MTSMTDSASERRRKRIDGWRWAGRLFLLFMLLYTALPMVWMLLTSIKSGFAAMAFPPEWWPSEPTLASYQKLLDPQNSVGQDFLRFFWNSLFVSTLTTILAVWSRCRRPTPFALQLSGPASSCFSRCCCATCSRR